MVKRKEMRSNSLMGPRFLRPLVFFFGGETKPEEKQQLDGAQSYALFFFGGGGFLSYAS